MEIEDILRSREISFKRKGNDLWINCLNPEHEDRNPSMSVDSITGIYHCFSCGFKGSLASIFDIELNSLDIRRNVVKRLIREKYVETQGIEYPKHFSQWSEGDWRGISEKTLHKFGAFVTYSEEKLLNRIVFPVWDMSRKIRFFIGRSLSKVNYKDKYYVHPAGAPIFLYPLPIKPINGKIILVEGIVDMINLWDKGLTNTVTCFGLNVSKSSVNVLKTLGIFFIDIAFDNDENEAGNKAAEKLKEFLESEGFSCRIVNLPVGKDPGDLSEKEVVKLKQVLYGI